MKNSPVISNSLAAAILYILGSEVLIVIGRGWQGFNQLMVHRYKVFSAYCIIILIINLLHLFQKKQEQIYRIFIPVLFITICLSYLFFLPSLRSLSDSLQVVQENVRNENLVTENYNDGGIPLKSILNTSKNWLPKYESNKITDAYNSPDSIISFYNDFTIKKIFEVTNMSPLVSNRCAEYNQTDSCSVYQISANLKSSLSYSDMNVLVLKGDRTFYFSEKIEINNFPVIYNSLNGFGKSTFMVNGLTSPSGKYEIQFLKQSKGLSTLIKTNKYLNIPKGINDCISEIRTVD